MYRALFFSTLTGTLAGIVSAMLTLLICIPLSNSRAGWLADATTFLVFALCAAIFLFLYFDRILLGKIRGISIGWGVLFGGCAGLVAAALSVALRLGIANNSPSLYRIAVWALCTSVVGLGIGLRWFKTNRARSVHAYVGGLAGGLFGGAFFVLFAPHVSAGMSLAGLCFAGAGTGFGAGIAPILIRNGLVRFISSGDARAQNKLGNNKTAWDLEIDESYVLGSAATTQGGTKFQQGADIMIPDSSIAPRHAVLFSKDGRYYIARHPEASGAEGIAKYVLRIKGKTVVASQELHPGDDVMIGRTALRFESRKQGE
jgi:hypothetical protein